MISRLSALAATFAILGTTSLAIAASAHQPVHAPVAKAIRTVQLERVVVHAKRLKQAAE
jgi:hypothetical protein